MTKLRQSDEFFSAFKEPEEVNTQTFGKSKSSQEILEPLYDQAAEEAANKQKEELRLTLALAQIKENNNRLEKDRITQ